MMIGLMIVDDEEGVRRSLRKVLEQDGYDILLAENGQQAVQMVQQNRSLLKSSYPILRCPAWMVSKR